MKVSPKNLISVRLFLHLLHLIMIFLTDSSFDRRVEIFRQMYSVDHSLPPTGSDSLPSSADVCPTKVLFLVLHGGVQFISKH